MLGLFVGLLLLLGLMCAGEMGLIQGFIRTGKPLAALALSLLPGDFWHWLTGVEGAAAHPAVRSFLQLCVALAQLALLLAAGLYRGFAGDERAAGGHRPRCGLGGEDRPAVSATGGQL